MAGACNMEVLTTIFAYGGPVVAMSIQGCWRLPYFDIYSEEWLEYLTITRAPVGVFDAVMVGEWK